MRSCPIVLTIFDSQLSKSSSSGCSSRSKSSPSRPRSLSSRGKFNIARARSTAVRPLFREGASPQESNCPGSDCAASGPFVAVRGLLWRFSSLIQMLQASLKNRVSERRTRCLSTPHSRERHCSMVRGFPVYMFNSSPLSLAWDCFELRLTPQRTDTQTTRPELYSLDRAPIETAPHTLITPGCFVALNHMHPLSKVNLLYMHTINLDVDPSGHENACLSNMVK